MVGENQASPSRSPAPSQQKLPSLPALPPRPTSNMSILAQLRVRRDPKIRPGVTLRSARSSNMEAWLAQFVGKVNTPPCSHCFGWAGPFVKCVSVSRMLGGSCANCHYGGVGQRCSLRSVSTTAKASPPRRFSRVTPGVSSPSIRRNRAIAEHNRAIARHHEELAVLYEEAAEEEQRILRGKRGARSGEVEEYEEEEEEEEEKEDGEEEDEDGEEEEEDREEEIRTRREEFLNMTGRLREEGRRDREMRGWDIIPPVREPSREL
ncbi:hypothetical protein NHQ30_004428 [Ciborinia camelliae]|nr:hypothetical protein NHQ30_004428 [Ciborinia camelliae]